MKINPVILNLEESRWNEKAAENEADYAALEFTFDGLKKQDGRVKVFLMKKRGFMKHVKIVHFKRPYMSVHLIPKFPQNELLHGIRIAQPLENCNKTNN